MRRATAIALALAPVALAAYAATLPWAEASVVKLWGVSRSPAASLLVVLALVGAAAAAVLAPAPRPCTWAGPVHATAGLVLCATAGWAYHLIRESCVVAFGLLTIASVRPARGFLLFSLAALWMFALGAIEVICARRRARAPTPG